MTCFSCLTVELPRLSPFEMDNYLLPSTAVVAALAVSVLLLRRTSGDGYGKILPPGPPPTFLVGHTFQIPTTRPWTYFEDLGRLYGLILVRTSVKH